MSVDKIGRKVAIAVEEEEEEDELECTIMPCQEKDKSFNIAE